MFEPIGDRNYESSSESETAREPKLSFIPRRVAECDLKVESVSERIGEAVDALLAVAADLKEMQRKCREMEMGVARVVESNKTLAAGLNAFGSLSAEIFADADRA